RIRPAAPGTTAVAALGVATGPELGASYRVNVAPPSCEKYTAFVTVGPVNAPSMHVATRSLGVEAARYAAPPALAHGGVHLGHWPSLPSSAPPTTVRSFSRSQPRSPANTSWVSGTGPAPIDTPVACSVHCVVPTGAVHTFTVPPLVSYDAT